MSCQSFNFKVDVPLAVDAGEFLRVVDELTSEYTIQAWSAWKDRCRNWRQLYPVVLAEQRAKTDNVSLYVLIETLSRQMKEDDLLVPGSSGACSDVCMQTFKITKGQKVVNSPGLGAMGFGLPHSIGACLASGMRRTICVNGDGGFQLNIQDLETVHRLQLPIKYFILNNHGYGSIRGTQNNYFQGRLVAAHSSSGLTLPNIRRISDAYGIPNGRIANHAELEEGVNQALAGR